MSELIRKCPKCRSERLQHEMHCGNVINDILCEWPLFNEPVTAPALDNNLSIEPEVEVVPLTIQPIQHCINGHEVADGDLMCFVCGGEITSSKNDEPFSSPSMVGQVIGDWTIEKVITRTPSSEDSYLVRGGDDQRKAYLIIYKEEHEPDKSIYQVMENMDHDHLPDLISTGRWHSRPYEIHEWIEGGSLSEVGYLGFDEDSVLNEVIREIAKALLEFSKIGLRHRDINPNTILIRERNPLDLVITEFGSARLSDFDLDVASPLTITRYSAPEAIVGAISAASDWWSLGMIVLEQVTNGACFKDINEQAFLIHVVTRGVELPNNIQTSFKKLLCGLLARDPHERWKWDQVERWLNGEDVELPKESTTYSHNDLVSAISLAGHEYYSPEQFSLAASEAELWTAGMQLFQNGTLETWIQENDDSHERLGALRRITGIDSIDDEIKYSLALMTLNSALPLVLKGEIVTPSWLTQNVEYANKLVFGSVPNYLESVSREAWLSNLKYRSDRVISRASMLEIELDDFSYRHYSIITSRAKLEIEETLLRQSYPDSDHAGLASLLHRKRLNEEDLLVLLCAKRTQFTPLTLVLERAEILAGKYEITSFDKKESIKLLILTQSELHSLVDERLADFSRCDIEKVNDWADTYRVERRLALHRIVVLLSVEITSWIKPEKQQYKENIIKFYEKRVVNSVLRGPLVRLTIGKTSAKIDIMELGTELSSSGSILNHLLDRNGAPVTVDPQIFLDKIILEQRVRRLINQAVSYRRETGIDSLYMGFPFLLMKSQSKPNVKPRVIPLLLWPISMNHQNINNSNCAISFDKEREEIRINPALEGLLGSKKFDEFKELKDEILGRTSVRCRDIVEIFSSQARVLNYELTKHPSISFDIDAGSLEIECSAVLFNAKFVGQAISEDLRQLRQLPVENTALDPLIKMNRICRNSETSHTQLHQDKYSIVSSDPSQDSAINLARNKSGVVIEGPPGTGKSQTIVNIIADSIGRGESILVVCQKQAALNVVRKRLEAENLTQRICGVIDINRDRQPVIRTIREQIEQLFGPGFNDVEKTKNKRSEVVERLVKLENDVNNLNDSIFKFDENLGRTYREIVCELIGMKDTNRNIYGVPELRSLLVSCNSLESNDIERKCVSLSNDWINSNYEKSSFHGLKLFSADESIVSELKKCFTEIVRCELEREKLLAKTDGDFDDGNVENYNEWIISNDEKFTSLENADFKNLEKWHNLYYGSAESNVTLGKELHRDAKEINEKLRQIKSNERTPLLFEFILKLNSRDVARYLSYCKKIIKPKGMLSFLNFARIYKHLKIKNILEQIDGVYNSERIESFLNALCLELKLRPLRNGLARVASNLNIKDKNILISDFSGLRVRAEAIVGNLQTCLEIVKTVRDCPRQKDAISFIKNPTLNDYTKFKRKLLSAVKRVELREKSLSRISNLSEWFTEEWLDKVKRRIAANKSLSPFVTAMSKELPTLIQFQSFRLRTSEESDLVFKIFAVLREIHNNLLKEDSLETTISLIIRRETLLAWKGKFEESNPVLLSDDDSLERMVQQLDEVNQELTELNKKLLGQEVVNSDMGTSTEWESITRLRGPRTKKLREFIDLGNDMGLMKIKPVWLMNPEVVSQVLPLKSGLFDVVIFDEASQMLVDHSLPSLYRAKRVVISGDEKQMPPSSSFSRKIDTDEEDISEELDEDMSEAEISALEEAWNRKEIKDCPDLLALGRSVLPYTTLQIHYRSEYNALIEFSNYAFYSGKLNVPAKHPVAEIRKVKPVEVIHAGGIYIDQTNPQEGEEILKLLKRIWLNDGNSLPSIGVVTFNLKQAELIEGLIQNEASRNDEFARVYLTERERFQKGEDMGFFVKNVENVQGDERDYILFSTTFGLNEHGSFRRNFGALGHKGGEKRLNVAITRARYKVIIVTSMPIDKISDMQALGRLPNKPRDYIQAYLDYADKKSRGEIELAKSSVKQLSQSLAPRTETSVNENLFVVSVERFIKALGYSVVHANDGDAFGLDLAIENPATGLFEIGIECDAPRHQLLKTASAREIWRKKVLQRSVAHIHRIGCNSWFKNNQVEKEKLTNLIETIFIQSENKTLV